MSTDGTQIETPQSGAQAVNQEQDVEQALADALSAVEAAEAADAVLTDTQQKADAAVADAQQQSTSANLSAKSALQNFQAKLAARLAGGKFAGLVALLVVACLLGSGCDCRSANDRRAERNHWVRADQMANDVAELKAAATSCCESLAEITGRCILIRRAQRRAEFAALRLVGRFNERFDMLEEAARQPCDCDCQGSPTPEVDQDASEAQDHIEQAAAAQDDDSASLKSKPRRCKRAGPLRRLRRLFHRAALAPCETIHLVCSSCAQVDPSIGAQPPTPSARRPILRLSLWLLGQPQETAPPTCRGWLLRRVFPPRSQPATR